MGTIWLDAPLSEYMIHKIAEAEGGYNYYLYIHAKGQSLVMRENTAGDEYLYAKSGQGGADWATRASLSYITYDKLI